MLGRTHILRRMSIGLALGAVVAVVAVPSALAGGFDGRSPDTRDAALSAHAASYGTPVLDGRSPDTRDAALNAEVARYGAPDRWFGYVMSLENTAHSPQLIDGRSPDTRDFAALAHAPVVTVVESPGFQWGDFGIGIVAALGAVLIVFCTTRLLAGRQSRKQTGPVATA
jgi:hypothetical protein